MPTLVWVMMVLVFADGEWRQWNTYTRFEECEEVRQTLIHHREDKIIIVCAPQTVQKD